MLAIWYLGLVLVVGAGLVGGNAIHHIEVTPSVEGTAVLKVWLEFNSNCCPVSVETCNGCWLLNSCFSGAVIKNLSKISLRNILCGNLITSS